MKFVLLQVTDEIAEGFAKMTPIEGYRAVGIYDIPKEACGCTHRGVGDNANWRRDEETARPLCVKCGEVSRAYVRGYPTRVRMAFGRNIIKKLRG